MLKDFAHFFFFTASISSINSTWLGVFVQVVSPSSLYNPKLTPRRLSWDNRNSPIHRLRVHVYSFCDPTSPQVCPIEATHCYVEVRPYFAPWHVIASEWSFCVLHNHDFYVMEGKL